MIFPTATPPLLVLQVMVWNNELLMFCFLIFPLTHTAAVISFLLGKLTLVYGFICYARKEKGTSLVGVYCSTAFGLIFSFSVPRYKNYVWKNFSAPQSAMRAMLRLYSTMLRRRRCLVVYTQHSNVFVFPHRAIMSTTIWWTILTSENHAIGKLWKSTNGESGAETCT